MNEPMSGVLRPHISLDGTNVDASVMFYAALFGADPVKVKSDYAKFELQNPPLNFSINMRKSGPAGGQLNHLGFQVAATDDVLHTKERLEASGLITFDEMDVSCCYAKQDKIWVHDPDGTPWEIFVVTEANLEHRDDRMEASSSCCVPSGRAEHSNLELANESLTLSVAPCC